MVVFYIIEHNNIYEIKTNDKCFYFLNDVCSKVDLFGYMKKINFQIKKQSNLEVCFILF